MTDKDNVIRPSAWRGTRGKKDSAQDKIIYHDMPTGRVLLLIDGEGNRKQLAEQLNQNYCVVEPDDNALPAEGFDLAVVDRHSFQNWHDQLLNAKTDEQPTFLPVMLILPRKDLRQRASAYWDVVDEFIISPINRNEFLERVALLLRTRRMAQEQQNELAYIVNHDRSTGLPNQNLFMDRLQGAIHDATITNKKLYVVVIHAPLERITKSLGSDALERAVQIYTTRLRQAIGDHQSLARLSTEHWGLLCTPNTPIDTVISLCQRAGRFADEPIEIDNEKIHMSAYIGIGTYPDDASTANETLNMAYGALSQAEKAGEPYFYSRTVQDQALRFLRTEARLHDALTEQQFELWFQPQFSIHDGTPVGAEALIRWRLPSGEMVSPGDFIPVAESSGFITRIDRWVLETACQQIANWQSEQQLDMRIAVNITPDSIAEDDFVPWIKELFTTYKVSPSALELELTETMFCKVDNGTLDKLNNLKTYGTTIAIDDFGTGYSSLGYLHQLPIGILKIDKSFIDRVPGDSNSEGITEAVIGLGHHFNLEIVAEGIETEKQLDYLRQRNVHTGQGFLIARPMQANELLDYMRIAS